MAKNLIPLIAKELGLEIGEEFETTSIAGKFKFNLDGLLAEHREGGGSTWINASPLVLKLLITGRCEIIKLPFEPKYDEKYWTYNIDWQVDEWTWLSDAEDYCRKGIGCVFRTKEEAIAARPKRYKALTGKEWQNE